MPSKVCTKCREDKPLSLFSRDSGTKDGYCYHCKSCCAERVKAWFNANPERRAQHRKKWRDANLEQAKAIEKRSYEENRDARLEYKRLYAATNRPRYTHYTQKRKVAQGRATPSWASVEAIVEIYRRCAEITEQTGVKHHVDHVVPLQGKTVCGLHVENNLQILPGDTNRRKANKHQP